MRCATSPAISHSLWPTSQLRHVASTACASAGPNSRSLRHSIDVSGTRNGLSGVLISGVPLNRASLATFLELEAESLQLAIEQLGRLGVAGDHDPRFGRNEESRRRVGRSAARTVAAGSEPGKVQRALQQDGVELPRRQELLDRSVFVLDIGKPVRINGLKFR